MVIELILLNDTPTQTDCSRDAGLIIIHRRHSEIILPTIARITDTDPGETPISEISGERSMRFDKKAIWLFRIFLKTAFSSKSNCLLKNSLINCITQQQHH